MEPLFTPRFVKLWLFQFVTFFSAFQLLPVIPLRIVELGGSKAAAGLFLGVYTFASALAAPIMGTVADHVGRKRMLITASALFVLFSLAYGVIPWLPVVLLIGLVHGALWSSILSSASAIMTDFIPITRRTEGLAWWGISPTLAISVAPAVGLFVFRFGWIWLCVEIACISAMASLWATRIEGGGVPDADETRAFPLPKDLWDWKVMHAALSLGVVAFGYGGITSYIAIHSRERGIQPESLFFTVFAITIILVRVTSSHLGDRFGPKVLLYPAFAAMPVSFAILSIAHSRVEMTLAAILFGIGLGASFPAFMTFVLGNSDDRHRGRTFGSVILAFDTGIGLGSVAIGAIGDRLGLGTAFAIAAGIACLSIPIFVATSRRLVRGTAVADTATHARAAR